jgi:hypothetical protein
MMNRVCMCGRIRREETRTKLKNKSHSHTSKGSTGSYGRTEKRGWLHAMNLVDNLIHSFPSSSHHYHHQEDKCSIMPQLCLRTLVCFCPFSYKTIWIYFGLYHLTSYFRKTPPYQYKVNPTTCVLHFHFKRLRKVHPT